MEKILALIFIGGLFSCSPTGSQTDTKVTAAPLTPDNLANEHDDTSNFRDLDSDSLGGDTRDMLDFLPFQEKGTKVKEKEYAGGDCSGKFKQIALGTDTLTIDKHDCGEYGFGNTQFITTGDSLRYVRKYTIEWSPDDKGNEFIVSETIYEFRASGVLKKTREKSIETLKNARFNERSFRETEIAGEVEYDEFEKELRGMGGKEQIDE
jgi:hypothetical protein